jgi:hypothetical protein
MKIYRLKFFFKVIVINNFVKNIQIYKSKIFYFAMDYLKHARVSIGPGS